MAEKPAQDTPRRDRRANLRVDPEAGQAVHERLAAAQHRAALHHPGRRPRLTDVVAALAVLGRRHEQEFFDLALGLDSA